MTGFDRIALVNDTDWIARMAADLALLWPKSARSGPLGLAVSGGPDSLALLLLAHAALPGDIAVASVDHGLRAEAAAEVAMVEKICAALDIAFTAIKVELRPGNLQARAREARYRALGEWAEEKGLGAIATAHHADDQAETLLMRLARGSGLSGLAGVRASSHIPGFDDLLLIRPLLGWRKAELEDVVAQSGISPARDPSNTDPSFDRVRVREHLAHHDWLAPEQLARSASNLGEAWLALQWFAEIDWEDMVQREGSQITYYANVPRAVAIETIVRIIAELGGVVSRSEAGRAFDRLWHGENASLGGVLVRPGIEKVAKVGVEMRAWRFVPEPPRALH
ncbi:MAG: tRNA lysidine(34) synthetase TilS [Pseudomonadota bacterium]